MVINAFSALYPLKENKVWLLKEILLRPSYMFKLSFCGNNLFIAIGRYKSGWPSGLRRQTQVSKLALLEQSCVYERSGPL